MVDEISEKIGDDDGTYATVTINDPSVVSEDKKPITTYFLMIIILIKYPMV